MKRPAEGSIRSIPARRENEGLHERDWNFDAVPDDELVACCYWEYARESEFIRDVRRRCLDPRWEKLTNTQLHEFCGRDIERIQSIGYPAEAFLRGWTYKPGRSWQSEDPRKPGRRHPDALPLTGSFPGPWQGMSKAERKFRAHIRTDVEQMQIVPIKLAHWSWAKEIARETQLVADAQHEAQKNWERRYLRREDNGTFTVRADAPPAPEPEPLRPGTRWGMGETLMVDIAWEYFTNDEIAAYVRQWLKQVRPASLPGPYRQGRNKTRDWRANLTRLAVLRLLSRYTPLQLVDDRENRLPAVWKTRQFAGRKWSDVTKWHDARREAAKFFHVLFPFLPASATPISWRRRSLRQ